MMINKCIFLISKMMKMRSKKAVLVMNNADSLIIDMMIIDKMINNENDE